MSDEVIFRDFTKKRRPITFQIDDVLFHCVPALGVTELQDISRVFRGVKIDNEEKVDIDATLAKMQLIFKVFLQPESHEAFVVKLKDRKQPVEPLQLLEIVQWIVEIYTNRPTQPSLSSSTGSPTDDGGTDSTAGAQLNELNLLDLSQAPS